MARQIDSLTDTHQPRRTKASAVRVGRSPTGRGVFARRRYKPSQVVGEVVGQLIPTAKYGSDYCFLIGDDTCLEPAAPFRFINHSCDPNCEFDWFDLVSSGQATGRRRVFLFAVRDIRPGDELTIEYNWSAAGAIPCNCRADSCRGWIVDPAQLDKISGDCEKTARGTSKSQQTLSPNADDGPGKEISCGDRQ